MGYYNQVAIAGLRLKSTPEDVRSLTYRGNKKLADGDLVAISDDGRSCEDVVADTKDFGVVLFQHIGKSGRTDDNQAEAYVNGDMPPIMVQGRIWVKPNAVVTTRGRTAKVYFDAANPAKLTPTATGNTAVAGFNFDSLTDADGLAVIQISNTPAA